MGQCLPNGKGSGEHASPSTHPGHRPRIKLTSRFPRKMLASASVPDRAAMPVVDQLGVPNPVELTPSSAIGPSPLRQCVTNEPSPSPPPSLSSGSSSSQEGNSKEQGLTVQEETSYIS